jgi:hypothetical protein
MRRTIANAFSADLEPFVDNVDDDRRRIDAPGFTPRLPSSGRRTSKRSRVLLSALIVDPDKDMVLPCRIENISESGARLKLSERRFVPPRVWLIAITAGLAYRANVIWRKDDRLGVETTAAPVSLAEAQSALERRLHKTWVSWRGS